MSIEKKSLISTLRTTKKANVAKDELGDNPASASQATKSPAIKYAAAKKAATKYAAAKKAATKYTAAKKAAQKA
jgi:hypothetical protein